MDSPDVPLASQEYSKESHPFVGMVAEILTVAEEPPLEMLAVPDPSLLVIFERVHENDEKALWLVLEMEIVLEVPVEVNIAD